MTIYEYEAPPEPPTVEGENVIHVPQKEGTHCTVLTFNNGMTAYIFREAWDEKAADRLAAFINTWIRETEEYYIGLPNSSDRESLVWLGRNSLLELFHIHDAVVESPLAQRKERGLGRGKHIVVPMGNGLAEIPVHGPGKRRR